MDDTNATGLRQTSRKSTTPVEVYGTNWCAATQMVRRDLDRLGVQYIYRNMDEDEDAARQVRWWTGGFLSHPTIQVGGNVLVEPSLDEVRKTLKRCGVV